MAGARFESSQFMNPTASSAKFTNALLVGRTYRLHANVDVFFKQGATDVAATVGANSHLLCAGQDLALDVVSGADYLAIIAVDAPSGTAVASVSLISNM